MKLDIITPLYKSKYLSRLLLSISSSKYVNDINVILVNDGDGTSYPQINQFPILSITYLSYEKNQGPGIARQYGLDHSSSPYVTFIDSDDRFLSSGIDTVMETIQNYPDKYLYLFDFIENNITCSKIDHYGTMGQVYARDFLTKYNIHYSTKQPYYLEDYGFNLACMCILKYYKYNDKIYHIAKPLAENIGPSDSLTRKNHREFIHKNWAIGAAYNTVHAINLALSNGVSEDFLLFDASKIMSEQFYFYCITDSDYRDTVLNGCKYYYNNCYKKFQNKFGTDMAYELWNSKYASKAKNSSIKMDLLHFLELCEVKE